MRLFLFRLKVQASRRYSWDTHRAASAGHAASPSRLSSRLGQIPLSCHSLSSARARPQRASRERSRARKKPEAINRRGPSVKLPKPPFRISAALRRQKRQLWSAPGRLSPEPVDPLEPATAGRSPRTRDLNRHGARGTPRCVRIWSNIYRQRSAASASPPNTARRQRSRFDASGPLRPPAPRVVARRVAEPRPRAAWRGAGALTRRRPLA
jgi:hypothetical protein